MSSPQFSPFPLSPTHSHTLSFCLCLRLVFSLRSCQKATSQSKTCLQHFPCLHSLRICGLSRRFSVLRNTLLYHLQAYHHFNRVNSAWPLTFFISRFHTKLDPISSCNLKIFSPCVHVCRGEIHGTDDGAAVLIGIFVCNKSIADFTTRD